ncbi:MAG: DegV family protein [Anaerolineae bacterium]|nr:DegV family protein [Anaerolineae bacterium]
MQIVTDQGMDLSPEQTSELKIHTVPLRITLEGKTYIGGKDIDYVSFYRMLSETEAFPTTSQPAPGEFADLYRQLAKNDPDILSIHMSSGLSGTLNAARMGAQMVPEANITIVDSKTLSCPLGWQVEAAAKAIRAGWALEEVLGLLDRVREHTDGIFTLGDLKYLIHGGRISHLKGLMASVLNIKPVIGVAKDDGKYYAWGQGITFKRAVQKLADIVAEKIPQGTVLRVQLLHGNNPEGVELLRERISNLFECWFDQVVPVAPILGAHTGPSIVGMAVAPLQAFMVPDLEIVPVEMSLA